MSHIENGRKLNKLMCVIDGDVFNLRIIAGIIRGYAFQFILTVILYLTSFHLHMLLNNLKLITCGAAGINCSLMLLTY